MDQALNLSYLHENPYKMTEEDVKRLIEFRASNEVLFTGRRNSAKIAWSTILKGLGLEGKLTSDQIAKKWDNLRTKYKDLKQAKAGGAGLESWPWYHIMDDALQGRLFNSDLVLNPESMSDYRGCSQNPDSTDILEFLIKTEMEDSAALEGGEAEPAEGVVPVGWRRTTEWSYKMSEAETEAMIKLRAANEALFTGKKHSAKPAWRAILHELGLQGKVTTEQLAKKWDNLKRRYKEVKCPAPGVESSPSSWSWFYRMHDAMEGRLAAAAPVLSPIVEDGDEDYDSLSPTPKKRTRRGRKGMSEFLTESEMDLLVDGQDRHGTPALAGFHRPSELTYKLTEEDTRRLIELRAANESLFTGRRNSAKPAWRGIVKELGLTGKISPDQVAKKWDNLKTKYKDLKFPPRGMEGQTHPASWPWFELMNSALEGRLAGKAPRVTPIWTTEEETMSPPADTLTESSSVSELEDIVRGDQPEADGSVTFIDASGEECTSPSELSYKMTDQDTRRMIRLRAANESLFTGRRNAAKAAWKAILKELGLVGKVSTYQMAKKWDNLKRRYKDLKYPPIGMENTADSAAAWPWFHLMNEAMEGRLAGAARLLTPVTQDDEDHLENIPKLLSSLAPTAFGRESTGDDVSAPCDRTLGDLERGWAELEKERAELNKERAAIQAERLWLEQERADLDRDRTNLNQQRAQLTRDRAFLEQQRAASQKDQCLPEHELGELRTPQVVDPHSIMLSPVGHPEHLLNNGLI
ncbi:uncharacterized protein zgc:171459 [Synchiropus splendidus]|uniref:uncharacterized protein zgc:171459 n=1 Tax=Synchiropus splendidus TaxID=270530 RepID=UPI00237D8469|nr:uncharacterized protein zgc:171459 [Synchiropus splendidus]XP_053741569.1 uncharacterized protein zgc:171459 [Synchiropus splendidus]